MNAHPGHLIKESRRTQPDVVVYVPKSLDGEDSVNEHFLVFPAPEPAGGLMAVWTQEWIDPDRGHVTHIVFARSGDGVIWSKPVTIAGPRHRDDPTPMASWAFPMVSRSGRIYVVYNQNHGVKGWILFHTGTVAGIYSDDGGQTWSEPQAIPMRRSPFDDPEGKIPPEWIVWQIPERDLDGNYFVGYSHWLNPQVAYLSEVSQWPEIESVIEFMRFTNVDDDPQPRDLAIETSGWGPEALRVPHRAYPQMSVAQEPSLVRLPDDRLFCVMRTCTGYIWWSQSRDDGRTWANPRPLLYHDHGQPLLNPVAPDPIYELSDGRFIILYHNNRGGAPAGGANDATPREPLFLSLGEFRAGADQPVWFSQPRHFMATGGVDPAGVDHPISDPGSGSLAMYASFTNIDGRDMLWYPDRKCFLLGREITPELLEGLTVPTH
jgi:hypothetical protein